MSRTPITLVVLMIFSLAAIIGAIVLLLVARFSFAERATFEVNGVELIMEGVIDGSTPGRLKRVLDDNPDLEWIVLDYVPGSADDEANLRAARMVRDRGLNTLVPSYAMIASGGTDFFLAGVERVVENGACIGVHSWSGGDVEAEPVDLPRNHPEHQKYLDFYRAVGIDTDFYWYTLQAAPAEGMHWMSESEMRSYAVGTDYEPASETDTTRCDDR